MGQSDQLKVSTKVHAPREDVFAFLRTFEEYGQYSDYITRVRRRGDGGEGTKYGIEFQWWKLTYTAWSRVTALDPPHTIEWELVKDLTASGVWRVEPTDASDHDGPVTRVVLDLVFDPDSANSNALDLPPLVSMSWVIDKVKALVLDEAKAVIRRVIADLEDEPRAATLKVHAKPTSL